jgi:hypothetical protein
MSITTDELLSALPHSTIFGKEWKKWWKGVEKVVERSGKSGENYSYCHLIVRWNEIDVYRSD